RRSLDADLFTMRFESASRAQSSGEPARDRASNDAQWAATVHERTTQTPLDARSTSGIEELTMKAS
ncbi:MAG TPA: hypothetical protein VMT82_04555, partial [candidate division Zixibacteria bacterium]|nr:hypothetical protein [candidate division Zixibacteria bacterium]